MSTQKLFLTSREFADLTGLPLRIVRKLSRSGVLKSLPGRNVYIHASEATPERLDTITERATAAEQDNKKC